MQSSHNFPEVILKVALHCLREASGNHETLHFGGNILLPVINPDMRHHQIPKIPSVTQAWACPVGLWLGCSCQKHPAQRGWQIPQLAAPESPAWMQCPLCQPWAWTTLDLMPPTVARSCYFFAMEAQGIMDCLDTWKRPFTQAEWADRCGTGPAEDLWQPGAAAGHGGVA